MPRSFTCSSSFTSSSICTRNQGSILVSLKMPSMERPARNASAMYQIRSQPASCSSWRMRVRESGALRSTMGSKPVLPVSRLRSALCRDSWKLRPMAITSPTDFIWVVRRSLAPANFSKLKRGILVTT
ncbi:hypothetical protein D3C75_567810 [compost metagenome]